MPRYFLNIRDGDDVIRDIAGDLFPNDASAKNEAVDRAQMMAEMGRFEEPTQEVVLCNAAGRTVASIRIADQMQG